MISDEVHPHGFNYYDQRGRTYAVNIYYHAHVHVEAEMHWHEYMNAMEKLEGMTSPFPDVFRGPIPGQRAS